MIKRVFLIVLDSLGVGELPDAAEYNDCGSNTLRAIFHTKSFRADTLAHFGLFNIDGVSYGSPVAAPIASYGRCTELSKGKDTTTGHWEIAGLVSERPFPVFPNGFPADIIREFERKTGRKTLCNKPYSGTEVIKDFGEEHLKTGALIVYTSADSVFQIAAHERLVPPEELYRYCRIARELLTGEYAVGRVIARPFEGEAPFARTARRHDFSLLPPAPTLLDKLKKQGFDVLAVGKIADIFAGCGVTERFHSENNAEGMAVCESLFQRDFCGLCFVNLVDFDMLYGHRNDAEGYAGAVAAFDVWLSKSLGALKDEDMLMITADHGCDPSTPSTDHSREYTPLLVYGKKLKGGVNLGTRASFADIAATIAEALGAQGAGTGSSFYQEIRREVYGLQ